MKIPLKNNKNFKKWLIGIVALILVIFLLNQFQKEVKNFFYLISSPIRKCFWLAGNSTANFFESFIRTKSLKKENSELQIKNQELLAEISALMEVKNENQILREILEINSQKEFKLVFSQVVGKDTNQDFILVNKGSEGGILEDMPVINQQKILFGKIFEVYKNFSRVMLISNKNSVFDVKIQNNNASEAPVYGVIKGKGNLGVFLDRIPFDAQIKEGDLLITSSLEGNFPKGLLVGEVKNPIKNDIKPFQTAEVQPLFNIKTTENLFIITNFTKP